MRNRVDSDWDNRKVSAQASKKHILELIKQGVGPVEIGKKSGVHYSTIHKLWTGRSTITRKQTQDKILSVTYGGKWINTAPASKKLKELNLAGVSLVDIARETGISTCTLSDIKFQKSQRTTMIKHHTIMALTPKNFDFCRRTATVSNKKYGRQH